MAFFKEAIQSDDKGDDGAGPGLGGGIGGCTPDINKRGIGDEAVSEGNKRYAFLKHKEANSNVGTGTAYESPSKLQHKMKANKRNLIVLGTKFRAVYFIYDSQGRIFDDRV